MAIINEKVSPFDYLLKKAKFTAERGLDLDITAAVARINIFENLEMPWLTGNLTFADNVKLQELLDFHGNEKLELEFEFPGEPRRKTLKKKFVVYEVRQTVKVNDNTEVVVLLIVEEHFFLSQINIISKAYEGKPSEIISKVLTDNGLNMTLLAGDDIEFQEPYRYLTPYITPLEVCKVIQRSATNENGYPFYLFSSLGVEDKLIFRSLRELLTDAPMNNNNHPFIWAMHRTLLSEDSKSNAQMRAEIGISLTDDQITDTKKYMALEDASRSIQRYKTKELKDILKIHDYGAIGSHVVGLNVNSFRYYDYHFDALQSVYTPLRNEVFPKLDPAHGSKQTKIGYDDKAFGGMHTKEGAMLTTIMTSNTYTDNYKNIYDTGTYAGEAIFNFATARNMYRLFSNEAIDIEVPGRLMFPPTNEQYGTSVGRNALLTFYASTTEAQSVEDAIDWSKTGQYLIYAVRHTFEIQRYTATMTCVKLSSNEKPTKRTPIPQ